LERLHLLIGESIQAYAMVEAHQSTLFELLLKIDMRWANAIFFAIQNAQRRNELLETLLELEFGPGLKKYWASCKGFLRKPAEFTVPHRCAMEKSRRDWRISENLWLESNGERRIVSPRMHVLYVTTTSERKAP
jgi:hypothetical protein